MRFTLRRLTALALLAVFLPLPLTLAACAKLPPGTPRGAQVAYYAGKSLEAVQEVQKVSAAVAVQEPRLEPIVGKVMIASWHAGDAGEKLADLAQAYDLAIAAGKTGDAAALAPKIEELLTLIDKAFPTKLGLPEGNAKKIATLIQKVFEAVNAVRAAVPELRTLVKPVPAVS